MNILILENDKRHALSMEKLLRLALKESTVIVCTNTQDAKAAMENRKIDLFIMNVQLGSESGIEFASTLRKQSIYAMTWLIFVTSDPSLMVRAFQESHCYYYILKPYDPKDFVLKVANLIKFEATLRNEFKKFLSIESNGLNYRIDINTILYIEINYKKLLVVTEETAYEFKRVTLGNVESQLTDNMLVKCHRSFLVNKGKVKAIKRLDNKEWVDLGVKLIPIGMKYLQNITSEMLF
jgi:two-component system, LytTR family, response regulator LytT